MTSFTSGEPTISALESSLTRLRIAVQVGQPRSRCLRRWSEFVRFRDGGRCVDCRASDGLAAHHIARKSFLKTAEFETGNGITLCRQCHRSAHVGFNGRADLSLPVDWQGGEKLDLIERLYGVLLADARERGMLRDDFYFLGDRTLGSFRIMQGRQPDEPFSGSRLAEAASVLSGPDLHVLNAIGEANGFSSAATLQLPGGITLLWDEGGY